MEGSFDVRAVEGGRGCTNAGRSCANEAAWTSSGPTEEGLQVYGAGQGPSHEEEDEVHPHRALPEGGVAQVMVGQPGIRGLRCQIWRYRGLPRPGDPATGSRPGKSAADLPDGEPPAVPPPGQNPSKVDGRAETGRAGVDGRTASGGGGSQRHLSRRLRDAPPAEPAPPGLAGSQSPSPQQKLRQPQLRVETPSRSSF